MPDPRRIVLANNTGPGLSAAVGGGGGHTNARYVTIQLCCLFSVPLEYR